MTDCCVKLRMQHDQVLWEGILPVHRYVARRAKNGPVNLWRAP